MYCKDAHPQFARNNCRIRLNSSEGSIAVRVESNSASSRTEGLALPRRSTSSGLAMNVIVIVQMIFLATIRGREQHQHYFS